MNKRLTAWALALVLAISMFTGLSVFAADKAEEVIEYSGDWSFAKAVGIFSDDYVPTDALTRIELAKCFANIVMKGVEPASDYGSALFDDVSYEDAPYADAMAGAGLMGGTGARTFSPDGNVTYSQLLKVFVSFLGYDVKAQALGGYPSGYMAVASELRIVDENAPYADSIVTYNSLASMFKRALSVPMFNILYYQDSTFIYREKQNTDYLREYLDICRYSGVVNAIYSTNVISDREVEYDEIMVGNTVFRFDAKTYNLADKLGYKLEVFYKKLSATEAQIIFYDEYDNNVIVLDGEDVEGFENGILYSEGKKEKRIKMDINTNVIYNGSVVSVYDETLFDVWNLSGKDGGVKAIDNDRNGVFDFVIIDAYESFVVDTITDDAIIPMYRSSTAVDISSYNQGENILFRNLQGKPVGIEKVVQGSVISVSKNLDGDVTNIVVTVDTYTGEVEEIEIEDGKYYVTVGGTKYNPSVCLSYNPQITRLRPGNKVTMMFNKGGLLSDIEMMKYQTIDTAYLIAAKRGKGLLDSETASIRIFSSGGFFATYELSKKIEVLQGTETYFLKPSEVLDRLGFVKDAAGENTKDIIRQPFMYKKNKEGQITWMNILEDGSGPIDGIYKYENIGLSESPRHYSNSFEGKILIKGTAIFSVPNEENRYDEDYYNIITLSNKTYSNIEIYGSKKESRIATAIVIPSTTIGANITSKKMVVDSITKALDPDGFPSVKVKGYINGVMSEYYCEESLFESTDDTTEVVKPESGDVVSIKVDRQGKIIEYSILYDMSEKDLIGTTNPTTSYFDDSERYLLGRIDWSDSDSFVVEIDDGNGNLTKDVYLKATSYKYYVCEDLGSRGVNVRTAKAAEIFAYPESFGKENKVFMWTYYTTPQIVVIYR